MKRVLLLAAVLVVGVWLGSVWGAAPKVPGRTPGVVQVAPGGPVLRADHKFETVERVDIFSSKGGEFLGYYFTVGGTKVIVGKDGAMVTVK